MTLPTIGEGLTTSIYGTNASNAVSYNIPNVTQSTKMSTELFLNIAEKAVAERVRRGSPSITIPADYYTGKLFAYKIQEIKTNVEVSGQAASEVYLDYSGDNNQGNPPAKTTFPQAPAPSGNFAFVSGAKVTAAIFNQLIAEINSAGQACTCNCNYCTCNCNYCTCNCNYSCTCNCNYSDEQLKSQVEYM